MQVTNQLYYFRRETWLQIHRHQNSIQAILRKHHYTQFHYDCPFYMLLDSFQLVVYSLKGLNSDANL